MELIHRNTTDEPVEVPFSTKQMEHLLVLQHKTLGKVAIGEQYQETLTL